MARAPFARSSEGLDSAPVVRSLEQHEQLDLFRESLPDYPYCTDDFEAGVFRQAVKIAQHNRYIQPNHTNSRIHLVFDIDHVVDWPEIPLELGLPWPNIFVQNKQNGHAHAFYTLEIPVHLNNNSSQKAIRYAAAIDCAYTDKLGADYGYSGLLAKNPLHEHWQVFWSAESSYTLGQLSECVDLSRFNDRRKRMPDVGLGRNVNLFNNLRCWAYKAIRQGWPDYDQWFMACLDRARMYNSQFPAPLQFGEVQSTAKSVAGWTHKHMSPEGFSALQSARGERKGKALRDECLERAIALHKQGLTHRQIGYDLEVSHQTIGNWLKRSLAKSHIR